MTDEVTKAAAKILTKLDSYHGGGKFEIVAWNAATAIRQLLMEIERQRKPSIDDCSRCGYLLDNDDPNQGDDQWYCPRCKGDAENERLKEENETLKCKIDYYESAICYETGADGPFHFFQTGEMGKAIQSEKVYKVLEDRNQLREENETLKQQNQQLRLDYSWLKSRALKNKRRRR